MKLLRSFKEIKQRCIEMKELANECFQNKMMQVTLKKYSNIPGQKSWFINCSKIERERCTKVKKNFFSNIIN
jgi:hypothetical protein